MSFRWVHRNCCVRPIVLPSYISVLSLRTHGRTIYELDLHYQLLNVYPSCFLFICTLRFLLTYIYFIPVHDKWINQAHWVYSSVLTEYTSTTPESHTITKGDFIRRIIYSLWIAFEWSCEFASKL